MIAFRLDPITIEITEGDIALQTADAIVNAANNHFWMGSGVAGAIKYRGGVDIEVDAMAQGPVEPGECVVTSGGKLAARYVIHAAVMGQDLETSGEIIGRATRNALRTADVHRLMSIAMPAFGTGVGGFPVDTCARIMIDAVRVHAPEAATVRLVRFVLHGDRAYRVFAEVGGELLGTPLDGPPDCPISS